jgi:hypothetical protein
MKSIVALSLSALVAATYAAEPPKVFAGLLEKDVPVRAQIGMVVPPAGIEKYVSIVEVAARKDPKWFREHTQTAKPGAPVPFDEKLGLTKAEYDEYLKLWAQREFKPIGEDIVLLLRQRSEDKWVITATGNASALSILSYSAKEDAFTSANGKLTRKEDIKTEADSILGAWTAAEWKFEEESSLGMTKEHIAVGKMNDGKYGLVVYRFGEVSSEGTKLADKSMVIRFPLGKAAAKAPADTAKPAPAPKKK